MTAAVRGRRLFRPIALVIALGLGVSCVSSTGALVFVELPLEIVLGGAVFANEALPAAWAKLGARPLLAGLGWAFALAVGVHLLAASLQAERGRTWRIKWTAAAVTAVVLMFSASLASGGIVHNGAWLVSVRWTETDRTAGQLRRAVESTCRGVSRAGEPGREYLQERLRDDPRLRAGSETVAIALVYGSGGHPARLVAFPRYLLPSDDVSAIHDCDFRSGETETRRASDLPGVLDSLRGS